MSGYETLLGRSLRRLRRAWSELGSTLRGERHEIDPALGAKDAERLGEAIRDCLGSPGGDYARRTQAARIGQA